MAYIIYIEPWGGTMAPVDPKEDPPLSTGPRVARLIYNYFLTFFFGLVA